MLNKLGTVTLLLKAMAELNSFGAVQFLWVAKERGHLAEQEWRDFLDPLAKLVLSVSTNKQAVVHSPHISTSLYPPLISHVFSSLFSPVLTNIPVQTMLKLKPFVGSLADEWEKHNSFKHEEFKLECEKGSPSPLCSFFCFFVSPSFPSSKATRLPLRSPFIPN